MQKPGSVQWMRSACDKQSSENLQIIEREKKNVWKKHTNEPLIMHQSLRVSKKQEAVQFKSVCIANSSFTRSFKLLILLNPIFSHTI